MQIWLTAILFILGMILFYFDYTLIGAIIATLGILSIQLITLGVWIYDKLFK